MTPSITNDILLAFADHILTITLNRPERLNAISGPMLHELAAKLKEANRDPDVRVVIITGAGKGFCSGLDLKDTQERMEGRTEALDERDRTAVSLAAFASRLFDQKGGNDAVDDEQHGREQIGMGGQQDAQRDRKREHPLAHRHARDHTVDQVGSALRHAPRPTRGAKPAPLTRKRNQLLVCTLRAAQAHKTVGEDAAFEKGIELAFDKLR